MRSSERAIPMLFERTSATAWMTAYRRAFSDIRYAKEFSEELERRRLARGDAELPEGLRGTATAPLLESRYKILEKLVRESAVDQIFELASGFSPRGLASTEGTSVLYVELDLPGVIAQKVEVASRIKALPTNLHFEPGSVLERKDLDKGTRHLDSSKPVAMIHEGLLRYLDFNEKRVVANSVRAILTRFRGVWITPDITLREILRQENKVATGQNEGIDRLTGITTGRNAFDSEAHAKTFFEGCGFAVEVRRDLEVEADLVSPRRLGIPPTQVHAMLASAVAFVMRPI
jgi:O-methyltransferase involved in polyketide biosynthesis